MRHTGPLRTAIAAAVLLAASAAFAHPRLVASTPADKSEVASPANITLDFSERLVPEFCVANLLMTSARGTASHSPVKVASGEKVMVITPAHPLPPGTYRVEWRAVSTDTHSTTGNITFEVK